MKPFRRETRTLCIQCRTLIPAVILDDGIGMVMESECPNCGPNRQKFLDDGSFYRKTERYIDRTNEITQPDDFRGGNNFLDVARDVYIDLTERCNFDCPICYTDANNQPQPDLSFEEIKEGIDKVPNHIVISLLGGEPTLRKDLAQIVRYLTGKGHLVKLITNGSRLSANKIDELHEAGLRWVVLQFDGFSDDIYLQTRKKLLLDEKFEVIERLANKDMIIVLASMIAPGVNDHEVGRILHYALCHPNIVQIGFLPASNIGRNGIDKLEMPSFMDRLDAQTGGRLSQDDFVRSTRQGDRYTRITGNMAYKSRTCVQGLFIYHEGYNPDELERWRHDDQTDRYHEGKTLMAIDRAMTSPSAIRRPRRLASALKTVASWNKNPVNPNLFGIVIEKFRDQAALDFDDAKNCTKAYLTRDGIVPNCIFNIMHRPEHVHYVPRNSR